MSLQEAVSREDGLTNDTGKLAIWWQSKWVKKKNESINQISKRTIDLLAHLVRARDGHRPIHVRRHPARMMSRIRSPAFLFLGGCLPPSDRSPPWVSEQFDDAYGGMDAGYPEADVVCRKPSTSHCLRWKEWRCWRYCCLERNETTKTCPRQLLERIQRK